MLELTSDPACDTFGPVTPSPMGLQHLLKVIRVWVAFPEWSSRHVDSCKEWEYSPLWLSKEGHAMPPEATSKQGRTSLGQRAWRSWRKFGQWMGDRMARFVLTGFYFTIALPFGLLVRLTQDPLDTRSASPTWTKRPQQNDTLDQARRMF